MTTTCKTSLVCLCFLLFSALPQTAHAGEPTEQLKASVEGVIDIFDDEELKKPENRERRRQSIRRIVDNSFDFGEMAKRALGLHWRRLTTVQRAEFVPLYKDLIVKTYILRLERSAEKYENRKVVYLSENVEGRYARVKTEILATNLQMPIEYRLQKEGEKWIIYDVVIEGVSLTGNYRSQFNEILRSGSYEELVRRIKDKIERLDREELK